MGTLLQHHTSSGRPTDRKLFAGYIRGVRVTASWGATWTTPENHLQVYLDLRVVVWLTVVGLRPSGEAVRLPGQPPQPQSQTTLCTVALPWVVIGLWRHESYHV